MLSGKMLLRNSSPHVTQFYNLRQAVDYNNTLEKAYMISMTERIFKGVIIPAQKEYAEVKI